MTTTGQTSPARRGIAFGMVAMGMALAFTPEAAVGEGVTGYYIGNSAHSLQTLANWKDQVRPGRFTDDGEEVGDYGGTMVFDNNSTGWGVKLTSTAMLSVSNMIFRGENLQEYYFPEYNVVYLESGGRFEVEANAGHSPYFQKGACVKIPNVSEKGAYVDIINHSLAHPLRFGGVGNTQTSTEQLLPEFRFSGEGDIVFWQSSSTPNGFNAQVNGSAVALVFGLTGTFKHEGLSPTYVKSFVVPASDADHRIELNNNGFYLLGAGPDNPAMTINADTLITGEKGLTFGEYQTQASRICVAEGKTLTLDVGSLADKYNNGAKLGLWFTAAGTAVLTSKVKSSIVGPYDVENSATLKTPIIGFAGATDSPMGTGNRIDLAAAGRLTYTGPGETTDRSVAIRYASSGYIEQAGTGPLVITGNFGTPNSGSSTLYLVNDTDQEATYSGLLADNGSGKLGILKQGSGLWRIGCAATYTGETKVLGGTLALGPSASITSSDLLLNSGALRVENGSAAFKSLTLQAGTANGLAVADGVSYTLPAFTRGDGATLDVSIGTGAELTMTGLADGRTPAWLTVNGRSGFILGGKVKTADDISDAIDAKGGVIPDAATAIVGITTAVGGGTSVSLEKPTTTVAVINQKQSAVDAEIALKSGETLKAAEIVVSDGAKNLTVAARNGAATLAGSGEDPVALNPASGTTLALAGDLAVDAAEIKGGGTVSIGPDVTLSALTTAGSPTLETAESSYRELDSWTVCNAKATYAGAGVLSVASLKLGGVGTADSGLTFAGGTVTNLTGVFGTGSGYARLDGGTFVENGTQLAWGVSPSQVTFEQAGGVYRHEGQFVLGVWDTQASVYLSGGTCTFNGALEFPTWNAGNNHYADGNRLNYILTVDGSASLAAGTINIGRINTSYTHTENEWANPAMINLNGGTAQVYQIVRDYRRSKSASSRAFVNFNGGTLRTTHAKGAFGAPEDVCDAAGESCGVDRVTVFAGGGTFDTDGRDVTSRMPISAPDGQGVVAVSVPDTVLERTFAAPPTVAIIGDGEGASARVLFNPQTGKVTGVAVLTPGWGYTAARARFNHGGHDSLGETAADLGDVSCGQFVKAGAGTYTFLCANTITDVKVTGGLIKNGVDNIFPADASLTLDGGDYDVNGFAQTFKDIAFGPVGGKFLNGTVTAGGLSCDFAAAVANRPGVADLSNVTFASGAKTVIPGYDPSVCASVNKIVLLKFPSGLAPASVPALDDSVVLPEGWSFRLTPTCLKLAKDSGMILLFR